MYVALSVEKMESKKNRMKKEEELEEAIRAELREQEMIQKEIEELKNQKIKEAHQTTMKMIQERRQQIEQEKLKAQEYTYRALEDFALCCERARAVQEKQHSDNVHDKLDAQELFLKAVQDLEVEMKRRKKETEASQASKRQAEKQLGLERELKQKMQDLKERTEELAKSVADWQQLQEENEILDLLGMSKVPLELGKPAQLEAIEGFQALRDFDKEHAKHALLRQQIEDLEARRNDAKDRWDEMARKSQEEELDLELRKKLRCRGVQKKLTEVETFELETVLSVLQEDDEVRKYIEAQAKEEEQAKKLKANSRNTIEKNEDNMNKTRKNIQTRKVPTKVSTDGDPVEVSFEEQRDFFLKCAEDFLEGEKEFQKSEPAKKPGPVASQPAKKPSAQCSEPAKKLSPVASEPARKPSAECSEPAKKPSPVASQPAKKPSAVCSEPAKKPSPVASDPARKPSAVCSEPAKKPSPVASEPAKKPSAECSEPAKKPSPVASEPAKNPSAECSEHAKKPCAENSEPAKKPSPEPESKEKVQKEGTKELSKRALLRKQISELEAKRKPHREVKQVAKQTAKQSAPSPIAESL